MNGQNHEQNNEHNNEQNNNEQSNNEQNNEQNQQNNQTAQNINESPSQQTQAQGQNGGGIPGFTGVFFPIFNELPRSPPSENNPPQDGSQGAQFPQIHVFVYPFSGTQGDDAQTTPGVFFFTPLFMPQQQVYKRASESAIKKLPIVTITKELVDSQASCPICLDHFSLSIGQEENQKTSQNVLQMPCNHMFCESCLFQWLRQNNSCPLCRREIEAEGETQRDNNGATPPNVPLFGVMNINNPPPPPPQPSSQPSPQPTINTVQSHSHSHTHSHNLHSRSSCALENVGCCEETESAVPMPIITLPQCHHRFHASCLRTSLLVEGYSQGDFNSTLNFRCPTCRSPAIVQSGVLKMSVTPHDEPRQQEQQATQFNLPDDMDLD